MFWPGRANNSPPACPRPPAGLQESAAARRIGRRLEIGASIGIALVSDAVADAETLVRNADMALYEVKNSGRNNYACYDDQLGRAHMIEQRMTAELNLAIERGEFRVVFQPRVSSFKHL